MKTQWSFQHGTQYSHLGRNGDSIVFAGSLHAKRTINRGTSKIFSRIAVMPAWNPFSELAFRQWIRLHTLSMKRLPGQFRTAARAFESSEIQLR
jgi:hypothetical protein